VKRHALAAVLALSLSVCASAPAAAPGGSLLALQRVGGRVVLERLDPLSLRPLTGAPRPLPVNGRFPDLLSPAGSLAVVSSSAVLSSATVTLPQPAAAAGSPLRVVVWSRDELVAMTPAGLVLVDAADGSARALGPSATDVVPAGRWLLAWHTGSRDGLYVYGPGGASPARLLFHLLAGARAASVVVHGASAYVCLGKPDVQPCTGRTAILDLRTGRELGRVTAPVALLR
jgi:hypothetical protein